MLRSVVRFRIALILIAFLLAGCSSGSKPGATVKGTVKNKDRVLKSGTITFHGVNNQTASASIQPDGTYVCEGVPMGEVKVTVAQAGIGSLPGGGMPSGPKAKVPEGAPPIPETDPSLPALVGKQETTNLKFNIDAQDKTLDVNIQ